jgi:NADH-quinone oxidoreductase subunit G
VEEAWLLARLADGLGSSNIDHRLRRRNFADQENDPVFPWLGCEIAAIQDLDAVLVIGSNLRREAPILAHRVRKAALRGARVAMVSREAYPYFFEVAQYLSGKALVEQLAAIAVAAAAGPLPEAVRKLCDGVVPGDAHREVANLLAEAKDGLVLVGNLAARDPEFAAIRALSSVIADLTGTRSGYLSEGSNSAGAHLAGLLPHRKAGGIARESAGLDAGRMLDAPLDALLLFGIEPARDHAARGDAVAGLAAQEGFVAAMTPYASPDLLRTADLLLPTGTFAETSGTYVNCEGRWQSFGGVASPLGEARPGWKVLRVLGNLLDLGGFDYLSSEAVRDELEAHVGTIEPDNAYRGANAVERAAANSDDGDDGDTDVPMYEVDAVVRRATALQLTPEAARAGRGDDIPDRQESAA